eukprot:615377-Prymnesium_polylepis.1
MERIRRSGGALRGSGVCAVWPAYRAACIAAQSSGVRCDRPRASLSARCTSSRCVSGRPTPPQCGLSLLSAG